MNLARIKNTCLAVLLAHTLGCAAESETDEGETVELEGQSQAVVNPVDWGYSSLPRGMYQANNAGGLDYCRFVGNSPHIFISCKLDGNSNEYAHNSMTGIDLGYSNRPRAFEDFNSDGRIDYCRYVGNSPNIVKRCVKGISSGFDPNQYWNPANMQPIPPESPFRWLNVSCTCTEVRPDGTQGQLQGTLCVHPGNGEDFVARGACSLGCMRRSGWGVELLWGYSAFGATCIQTFTNSIL